MIFGKNIFVGIIFLNLLTSSAFAESYFPQQVTALLSKHKIWQTIPYTKLPVGDANQNIPGIQKKWSVEGLNSAKPILAEKTNLSIRQTNDGKLEWFSESIDLSAPIQSEQINQTFQKKGKEETWNFEIIGNDSFTMKRSDGAINIIFTPEKPGKTTSVIHSKLKNIHAATAPMGFAGPTWASASIVPPIKGEKFLRHDLSAQKEVWVSPNFPKRHFSTVIESLGKWNKALGANLFQLKLQVKPINQDKCLSSNVLCLIWYGPEELPWTGTMALTSNSFDPETGNIIGGIISINNYASKKDLVPTPSDVVTKASSQDPGVRWVAEQYLDEAHYVNYIHPFPRQSLEYFLLHELGHFNGLNHNFAGSRKGTFNNPTDSIMDYLPFPVIFKANQIGKLDTAMVDLVYRGQKPSKSYVYCEATQFFGAAWVPGCDQRDLGDTLEWYQALGELSSEGFFKTLTFLKPDFTSLKVSLVEMISKYFNTESGPRAKNIICEHLDSNIQTHLNENNIELDCN